MPLASGPGGAFPVLIYIYIYLSLNAEAVRGKGSELDFAIRNSQFIIIHSERDRERVCVWISCESGRSLSNHGSRALFQRRPSRRSAGSGAPALSPRRPRGARRLVLARSNPWRTRWLHPCIPSITCFYIITLPPILWPAFTSVLDSFFFC